MKKTITAFLISVIFIMLLLCGCKDNSNNAANESLGRSKGSEEISIFSYKPDTLCPILSKNEANIQMLGIVYDSLITLSDTFYPEACLAENWSVSQNGAKWNLTLRQDAVWHDGGGFSAKDVLYTVNSIKKYEESIYSYNVSNIKDIREKGQYEVEVELFKPCINFVNLLYFPIIKASDIAPEPVSFKPVGTGPYRFDDRNEGNVFYLVSHDSWWGGETATECITVNMLPDNNTALYAFSSGSIDMTVAEDMNWGRFVDPLSASYVPMQTPIFHFLGINHKNEILQFTEIREAISLAIDRSKLCEEVMMGYATESKMPLHPDWFVCGDKKMECKQSLNDAKKELSKNGWEQNNGILQKVIDDKAYKAELEIIYNEDNTQRQDTAEQVKQNLEELGIKVSVKSTSFEDYQTCINEGNYDIFVGSYIVSPDLKFSFILGEENIFGFESQEMTAAMDGLKTKHSIQGIEDGYSDVIDCFDKLNPVVGLFFEEKIMIYNNRISEEVKPSYFDVYKGIELLRKEERK